MKRKSDAPMAMGRAASVAFLCGPNDMIALPPAEQILSDDGRFHYRGGRLPLPPERARRAETLARRALAGVPGLCGYLGVDLILGDMVGTEAIERMRAIGGSAFYLLSEAEPVVLNSAAHRSGVQGFQKLGVPVGDVVRRVVEDFAQRVER